MYVVDHLINLVTRTQVFFQFTVQLLLHRCKQILILQLGLALIGSQQDRNTPRGAGGQVDTNSRFPCKQMEFSCLFLVR